MLLELLSPAQFFRFLPLNLLFLQLFTLDALTVGQSFLLGSLGVGSRLLALLAVSDLLNFFLAAVLFQTFLLLLQFFLVEHILLLSA